MPRRDARPGPFDIPIHTSPGATAATQDQPTPRSRRVAQATIVVVLAAVAVGLAFALPNDDDSELADGGSTTRVEADGPTASASLLASDGRLSVDGELTDRGGLALGAGLVLELPDPSGSVSIDAAGMTNLIEPAGEPDRPTSTAPDGEPEATTTTTVWTEPTLPPESQWVDTGNGVLVPDLLLRIRFCESTNDYQAASRYSTARGAYQFLTGSWEWYGHAERTGVAQAHLATPAQQDQAALATLQAEGTGPWAESRPCWADPDIDPRYATVTPSRPTPTTTATTVTTGGSGSTETTAPATSTTAQSSTTTTTATTSTSSTTATTSTTAGPTSTS